MKWLRKKIREFRLKRMNWAAHERWFDAIVHRVPNLLRLPPPERARLRELTQDFLLNKKIFAAADAEIDIGLRVKIATLAAWPALYLGFAALDGFSSVIVYPDTFFTTRETVNPETGLVEQRRHFMAGETSQHGPIVISQGDLERDLAGLGRFGNVVLHEVAHKIDALDGAIDGVPPMRLQRDVDVVQTHRNFSVAMRQAFDALRWDLQSGIARFDAYAAHSPPEFFAVASEYYFLAPEHLASIFPQVFNALDGFYRGDRSA
jgi:MtfA peptidase